MVDLWNKLTINLSVNLCTKPNQGNAVKFSEEEMIWLASNLRSPGMSLKRNITLNGGRKQINQTLICQFCGILQTHDVIHYTTRFTHSSTHKSSIVQFDLWHRFVREWSQSDFLNCQSIHLLLLVVGAAITKHNVKHQIITTMGIRMGIKLGQLRWWLKWITSFKSFKSR